MSGGSIGPVYERSDRGNVCNLAMHRERQVITWHFCQSLVFVDSTTKQLEISRNVEKHIKLAYFIQDLP